MNLVYHFPCTLFARKTTKLHKQPLTVCGVESWIIFWHNLTKCSILFWMFVRFLAILNHHHTTAKGTKIKLHNGITAVICL